MPDNRRIPSKADSPKEAVFLQALESLFVGAKVEGDSGFVNLMRVKYGYFQSIRPRLMERIDGRVARGGRPGGVV